MRDKNMVRIILGILAIVAVTSMLAGAAWAQATFKTLHKFTGGADGNIAEAGLIFDQVGNLYGTTLGGGAQGLGTVFQLTPNKNGGWAEHVLHSFCSRTYCADGANPFAGLTRQATSMARPQAAALTAITAAAPSSDWPRARTEAGPRACCIASARSRTAPTGRPRLLA